VSEPPAEWPDRALEAPEAPPVPRRPRRRRRRRTPLGTLVRIALVVLVFAVGIALGEALNDGPKAPRELTGIRGVRQVVVTQTVATRTITVVVTSP